MKQKKKLIALLLATALCLGLAACAGGNEAPTSTDPGSSSQESPPPAETAGPPEDIVDDGQPKYGGSLSVLCQEFYNNFDPSIASNRNYALWYDRLWSVDYAGQDAPNYGNYSNIGIHMNGQIAETWDIDEDENTLTVKIRDGIYFQEKSGDMAAYDIYGGRQLLASDVKWSYDRLFGLGSGFDKPYESEIPWYTSINMLKSVEVTDDLTVVFYLTDSGERTVSAFMAAEVNIAGPEWDELSDEQKSDWRYCAGTGAFILTDFVTDSYMIFDKNESYYLYDERYPENKLPYLESVTIQYIQDSTNRLAQFISGNLDMLVSNGAAISDGEIAQLRDSMADSDYTEYVYLGDMPGLCIKLTNEEFQDIRVREALQYAIDLEAINSQYFGYTDSLEVPGWFRVGTEMSARGDWSDELSASYSTYNPEKARELLADAGYADGLTIEIVMMSMQNTDLFTLISEYLSEVGIKMNITLVSTPPEAQAVIYDGSNKTSGSLAFGSAQSATTMFNMLSKDGPYNQLFADDPVFEELFEKAFAATTFDEYNAVCRELDLYYAEQHWVAACGPYERISNFVSSKVGGYNGWQFWGNWNASTILSYLWDNEA